MENIVLGYDDNLGLPNDFAAAIGCKVSAYHNLTDMINAFEAGTLSAIFIPCGALLYVKDYQVISQALFGVRNQSTLQSNFVSTKQVTIPDIPNLKLGRVNEYCTTSFWAPLIFLMPLLTKGTQLIFINTNGFPDMLHKTAEKIVDCSMVWNIIMQQHPQDSSKVHEFFFKNDLPTPVIISKINLHLDILATLSGFKTKDSKAFFSGFKTPDTQSIEQFILLMKKASEHFTIKTLA